MHDGATPRPTGSRLARRPTRPLRTATATLLALALAASGAACSTAGAQDRAGLPKRGGTLRVVIGDAPSHLDPQQLYDTTGANLSRLMNRTLTTFRAEPGAAASEIVGDLATDTGRPSDSNKTWDFRLKDGLKWEDGSPVTCNDVKYGVERSFSKLFTDGAKYPSQYLEPNAEPYQGPFVGGNNNGAGLQSIECVDSKNIRFHLRQPVGDFGYTVAMSVFSPVPPTKDTKADYDKRPFSNGPYKIEESTDKHLTFVRNPFWDPNTDVVRRAYPDRIEVTWNADTAAVTNDIINSDGPNADAVAIEKNVAPNFVQQVINDPDLSKRAIAGSSGGVRYFAINTRTVTNPVCRQALEYGFNKRKYRASLGGAVFGDFATSMITPELKAHKQFDLYNSLSNVEGDPDKALELIKQASTSGKPCPTTIKLAYPDTKVTQRAISTVVEAYQRIGIEVQRVPYPQREYYTSRIGNPANGNDMMLAGWIPDWANGSAVIPALFDGRVIPKDGGTGNTNFSDLSDDQINHLIDEALAESNLDRQYILWGELDQKIQELGAAIPVMYDKALRMAGTNVRGGFIHPQFGQPDLVALGLGDPTK